ncbi:MAG: NAD(P)/FAD-dependent oxidoreductase [Candidatus Natronoplasma sp.]
MTELKQKIYDTAVIGAGAAGIAASVRCDESGLDVLLIESKENIGGIPLQCTHPGFGNFYYDENLTGTEFAERLIERLDELAVDRMVEAHVISIENVSDLKKRVELISPEGLHTIEAKTIIYSTGARERHRFETGIQGDRLSGVYTAGEAQTMMDIYGIMPGKRVVIVGSGDIGLIMARRFALENAEVVGVIEMLPYPGGLTRNVVQCLHDFDIPLHTLKMVKEIRGDKRVEEVVTVDLDEELEVIPGSEEIIECDTVALATGLIPYTKKLDELGVIKDPSTGGPRVNGSLKTSVPGIFAAGNVLAINDYVDFAAYQGEKAAESCSGYIEDEGRTVEERIEIKKGRNIRLVVPQLLSGENDVVLYARVKRPEPDVEIAVAELDEMLKKSSVKPGEMVRVELSKELLGGLDDELTLEVRR